MSNVVAFRSFSQFDGEVLSGIHDTVSPRDLLSGSGFTADIALEYLGKQITVERLPIYRISPLGAEINVSNTDLEATQVGAELDLVVRIRDQECSFRGLIVASVNEENGRRLIGLRWCEKGSAPSTDSEKRATQRWLCGGGFLPTGIAANPSVFNDYIYFKVLDISAKGMQLSTSLRNKLLIPGMIIEGVFSLPMVGELSLTFRILHARIRTEDGKDFLSLGVQFVGDEKERNHAFGQYLLQFSEGVTVKGLKEQGFRVRSVESVVDYSYVKSAVDYREVLELRKLTYSDVGKADKEGPSDQLGDQFDVQSRIVCARHHGKMVGSLRLSFHADNEKTEYEKYVTLPASVPSKSNMVVAGRVCTHPNYRGSDLVYGLMRQMILSAVQARKQYILGACEEHLMPFYKKVGFRPVEGTTFTHSGLNANSCQVVIMDLARTLAGEDVQFRIWSDMYSDLCDFLTKFKDVELTPTQNFKINIKKALSRLHRRS